MIRATAATWADITAKGIGISRQSSEDTEGTEWHMQLPKAAERIEEEHRDPRSLDVTSGRQEEQVQRDTTRRRRWAAGKHRRPSLPRPWCLRCRAAAARMDAVETIGKEIPRERCVVGDLCLKNYPLQLQLQVLQYFTHTCVVDIFIYCTFLFSLGPFFNEAVAEFSFCYI